MKKKQIKLKKPGIQSLFGILLFELNYLTNWIGSTNSGIQLIRLTQIITTFMPDIWTLIYLYTNPQSQRQTRHGHARL